MPIVRGDGYSPSTFTQDKDFPIYVTLEYNRGSVKFPINPETLKQVIPSESVTENIESIGEVSIPQRPSLSSITFNSFFWSKVDATEPRKYINWIKRWQASRQPANLIISNLEWFNMLVTCDSFSYWVNAGEEKDIYFEITLKEYKEYKAIEVDILHGNILTEAALESLMGNAEKTEFENVSPVFMSAWRPERSTVNKPSVKNVTETQNDDSIVAITRKATGDSSNWKDLYEGNKEVVAETFVQNIVPADVPLETPKSWNPKDFTPPKISLTDALKKVRVLRVLVKKLDQAKGLFNDLQVMLEDFEQGEGAMQEILVRMDSLYNIFQPDNWLNPLDSIIALLEGLKEMTGFPELAVGTVDQLIEILLGMAGDIAEFLGDW